MPSARIRLDRRPGGRGDRLRAYRVVLDGFVVGRITRGQSLSIEADPGLHEFRLAVDWCGSRSVELKLAPGQETHLECWPNATPGKALYWILFRRSDYIAVDVLGVTDMT
jgi:hypothetical protein